MVASSIILVSLISYSPNDPNFIISENTEIKNIFGLRGSMISDFLFQSIGLIAYLIPITLYFTGANIFVSKKQIIIDNLFYCVLYIIFGSLFFSYFKDQSFFLTVNGNGGFIGDFIKNSFLLSAIEMNENLSYYALIILTIFLFLISINFSISKIFF